MESFGLTLGKIISDGAIAFIALLLWKLDNLEREYSIYIDKLIEDYLKDPKEIAYLKNAHYLSKIQYLNLVTLETEDKKFLLDVLKLRNFLKLKLLPWLIYLLILGFLLQCLGLL